MSDSLSRRIRDARIDRLSRETSVAIDRAERACRNNSPRQEQLLRDAEAKLAEYTQALQ
jgi:hypothetical protein